MPGGRVLVLGSPEGKRGADGGRAMRSWLGCGGQWALALMGAGGASWVRGPTGPRGTLGGLQVWDLTGEGIGHDEAAIGIRPRGTRPRVRLAGGLKPSSGRRVYVGLDPPVPYHSPCCRRTPALRCPVPLPRVCGVALSPELEATERPGPVWSTRE